MPQAGFSIPLMVVCPLGSSATKTGRISYTSSSSLLVLSLSAASHIKVSGVLPLVIPPLRLHSFVSCHGFFFLAYPFPGEQGGALLFHVS